MTIVELCRPLALAAGPAAVGSLVLFAAGLAVHGEDVGALARGPIGATSNALALLSVLLLLAGLTRLAATNPPLREGGTAVLAAGAGTALLAGGAWAQLVLLPVLAVEAPRVADQGAGLLTAGYVVSFLAAGAGWLAVALRLRRDAVAPRGVVRALTIGAVLMLAPLPTRWVVLAVAVSLLARTGERVTAPQQLAVGA